MSSHRKNNKSKRKKKNKGKIHPEDGDYEYFDDEYELDKLSEDGGKKKNNLGVLDRFKMVAKNQSASPRNAVNNIISNLSHLKAGARRWREYTTTRRKNAAAQESGGIDRRKTGGMGLADEMADEADVDVPDSATLNNAERAMVKAINRNLVEYFARLGKSKDNKESVNLEYVESLLGKGARVDCTDKYGQSVLHEVARAWHTDVAKFLLESGANVNQADNYGRTPLHVAAAVDYPEMVDFLIKHGAKKEARTKGEHQTPVHFAARNDASMSLKMLIKSGCEYKYVRDYKDRTPLHVAAELDRSESARTLLELDDPAPAGVEDNCGQAAIVWMITKMPPVAKLGLDQFHTTDRANRKQYYNLHRLEPRKPGDDRKVYPKNALQVAVAYRRFDLIIHPVFEELIRIKWHKFGRRGALTNLFVNLLFIITWTIQGIAVEYDQRHSYEMPDQWWRIVVLVLAIIFTAWQIKEELTEFFLSKKAYSNWKNWREDELYKDIKHCHPRWPEEEQYLRQEVVEADNQQPQYFNDFWNIFDWICYALLMICILTHVIDVADHGNFIARLHIRIMAVTIIMIWLRLMKNARASALGPFIVMISHMAGDVLKFVILYLEFYIPYACAFWMLFGSDKVEEDYQGKPDAQNHTVTVSGMQDPSALLFSLFRLTLVDDYDYDGMKSVDSLMTDILVGTWLGLSAILMLNLFIALMSDTFQRVYDNAKANAVMQKAITILNIQEGLPRERREKFRKFIHEKCGPKEDFYDDDTTEMGEEDLKKVTIQIKEQLVEMQEQWDHQYSRYKSKQRGNSGEQLDDLQEAMRDHQRHQERRDDSDSENGGDSGHGYGGGDDADGGGGGRQVSRRKFEKEIGTLHDEMEMMQRRQEQMMQRFKRDMATIKITLQQMSGFTPGSITRTVSNMPQPGAGLDFSLNNFTPDHTTHVEIASANTTGAVVPVTQPTLAARPSMMSTMGTIPGMEIMDNSLYEGFQPRVHTPDGGTLSRHSSLRLSRRDTSPSQHRSSQQSWGAPGDEEWESLERQRKQDLERLKLEIAHKAEQQESAGGRRGYYPQDTPGTTGQQPSGIADQPNVQFQQPHTSLDQPDASSA